LEILLLIYVLSVDMEEEEPMELSGDRSRNGSFLHDFQSNSLSDMDVDVSFDRSYSAKFMAEHVYFIYQHNDTTW
jgi:hypothetical protein